MMVIFLLSLQVNQNEFSLSSVIVIGKLQTVLLNNQSTLILSEQTRREVNENGDFILEKITTNEASGKIANCYAFRKNINCCVLVSREARVYFYFFLSNKDIPIAANAVIPNPNPTDSPTF
jgi:hypothetical protein